MYSDENIILREPVFTFDQAKKAWGEGYWALDGYRMLLYVRRLGYKKSAPSLSGVWDYRPCINPIATRNVCFIRPVEVDEVPREITDAYEHPVVDAPDNFTFVQKQEYMLKKSWAILFVKWDSLSIDPDKFNTLLYKYILISDSTKQGIVLLDTKDLYVNVNPYEFHTKFEKPYPVEDLQAQKDKYYEWLTYAGFNRLYMRDDKNSLIETPWYYRVPRVNAENDTVGIKELPEYQVHPLHLLKGTFYPTGYDKEDSEE